MTTADQGVRTTARRLVALDIDGTLLGPDGKIPTTTVDALDLVRAAGHEPVLASGRSLVGLLPVATRLGLVEGFAVGSNGAVTVRLDPAAPAGYAIEDARRFDPGAVIHRTLALVPGARVGIEDVGRGRRLDIPSEATVAVGDGHNDRDMFGWAGRSYAMGHAPQVVRDAADEVTGTISQHGAVTVLHSLLPADIDTVSFSRLAAQIATAVHTARTSTVAIRVWHGSRAELSRCEIWAFQDGAWVRHAPVPAAIGATMRGIEHAVREAGLNYPRGDEGRRRAHWHTSFTDDGAAGFGLLLAS